MISIKINNVEFSVKPGISILDACKFVGVTVPRFCYHELLSIAGNCRMCLVEVEPFEKPVASCVAEVEDNMSIRVDTPFVKKARENVMEILLLNHPLDCPICDQAGECDLQDQAKLFGSNFSRNFFNRKGVEDKYCGPLIKTIMTRCISCTRCVRYSTEIAGVDFFGTLNRGGSTEIGHYVDKMFVSEVSGNVIDLCPVGALTSKPYAFKSRPWELRTIESIDTTDSLGSNVYVNHKENEVFRVIPKNNVNINLSLISDKARFSYDANHFNRIDNIYQYNGETKQFKKSVWSLLFNKIDNILSTQKPNIVINKDLSLEGLLSLKDVLNSTNASSYVVDNFSYISNTYVSKSITFKEALDSCNKSIILLGSNLRTENAIVNTRIKIESNKKFLEVCSLGNSYNDNLSTTFLYLSLANIFNVFEAKSSSVNKQIISDKSAFILVGSSFRNRIKSYKSFVKNLYKLNSNVTLLDLEIGSNAEAFSWSNIFKYSKSTVSGTLFGVNLSDNFLVRKLFSNRQNSIWVNTHGSLTASKSNIVIPSKTDYEVSSIYLNNDGFAQSTLSSLSSFPNSRSISSIFSSIFNTNKDNPKYSLHLVEQSKVKNYSKSSIGFFYKSNLLKNINLGYSLISTYPIKVSLKNFYLTNNFTRNSKNMLNCSEEYKKNVSNF
jgi:NADH-quinone oxidoreductase chain G